MTDSQDIETATTVILPSTTSVQPDSKTRRYDRQLRLWAASGQSALESSRILVLSASATSTSILKNLVLPGIGHFTILDSARVTPEDAGNNFFLEGLDSVGKSRAEEAVRLLREMNESVSGEANTGNFDEVLATNKEYLLSFTLIIAHNLDPRLLDQLSSFLQSDSSYPPLLIVRSVGFLADFYIQIHEHTVVDSHPEIAPSLRIDKPFPALLQHSLKLDFDSMDDTDHGHVPYIYILIKVMEQWKASHDGMVPKTKAEKKAFQDLIYAMKRKPDEENFDEAIAQAYRVFTETKVPPQISRLFNDPALSSLSPSSPPFFVLLFALRAFTQNPPHTLPISAALPDVKADTTSYVYLQKLYKAQAEEEKNVYKTLLKEVVGKAGISKEVLDVDSDIVDEFVRNSHGLVIVRGKKWGEFGRDKAALAEALASQPHETAIHLALTAVQDLLSHHSGPNDNISQALTVPAVTAQVRAMLPENFDGDAEFPSEEIEQAIGEVLRSPTADLPTTAAFLGGLVAQEAIKVITKQYVPVSGVCVVDMIASTTGVVGA